MLIPVAPFVGVAIEGVAIAGIAEDVVAVQVVGTPPSARMAVYPVEGVLPVVPRI
jgi:hypothetical protein